jgi:hypothetical protein
MNRSSLTFRLLCLALALMVPVPAAAAVVMVELSTHSCCCGPMTAMPGDCPCEMDVPGEPPPEDPKASAPAAPAVPAPEAVDVVVHELCPPPMPASAELGRQEHRPPPRALSCVLTI